MIEINLLPPRRKGIEKELRILVLFLIIWAGFTLYIGYLYYSNKKQQTYLYSQLSTEQKTLYEQNKKNQGAAAVSVEDYIKLTDSLQHLFYPTTILMDELARNLPKNAKLTQISYSLDGKVTLTGTFEEYDQIASYLHNIQLSPYVITASIKSIGTADAKTDSSKSDIGTGSLFLLPADNISPLYSATIEAQMVTIDSNDSNKTGQKPESSAGSK